MIITEEEPTSTGAHSRAQEPKGRDQSLGSPAERGAPPFAKVGKLLVNDIGDLMKNCPKSRKFEKRREIERNGMRIGQLATYPLAAASIIDGSVGRSRRPR